MPKPESPTLIRNINVRKKRGKRGDHIPHSINPFPSHLALRMKTLKLWVCQYGLYLHSKCSLHVGVIPPEHQVIVWTAWAIKRMQLEVHSVSSFLIFFAGEIVGRHPSLTRLCPYPSLTLLLFTVCLRMKSQQWRSVPSRWELYSHLETKFGENSRGPANRTAIVSPWVDHRTTKHNEMSVFLVLCAFFFPEEWLFFFFPGGEYLDTDRSQPTSEFTVDSWSTEK